MSRMSFFSFPFSQIAGKRLPFRSIFFAKKLHGPRADKPTSGPTHLLLHIQLKPALEHDQGPDQSVVVLPA